MSAIAFDDAVAAHANSKWPNHALPLHLMTLLRGHWLSEVPYSHRNHVSACLMYQYSYLDRLLLLSCVCDFHRPLVASVFLHLCSFFSSTTLPQVTQLFHTLLDDEDAFDHVFRITAMQLPPPGLPSLQQASALDTANLTKLLDDALVQLGCPLCLRSYLTHADQRSLCSVAAVRLAKLSAEEAAAEELASFYRLLEKYASDTLFVEYFVRALLSRESVADMLAALRYVVMVVFSKKQQLAAHPTSIPRRYLSDAAYARWIWTLSFADASVLEQAVNVPLCALMKVDPNVFELLKQNLTAFSYALSIVEAQFFLEKPALRSLLARVRSSIHDAAVDAFRYATQSLLYFLQTILFHDPFYLVFRALHKSLLVADQLMTILYRPAHVVMQEESLDIVFAPQLFGEVDSRAALTNQLVRPAADQIARILFSSDELANGVQFQSVESVLLWWCCSACGASLDTFAQPQATEKSSANSVYTSRKRRQTKQVIGESLLDLRVPIEEKRQQMAQMEFLMQRRLKRESMRFLAQQQLRSGVEYEAFQAAEAYRDSLLSQICGSDARYEVPEQSLADLLPSSVPVENIQPLYSHMDETLYRLRLLKQKLPLANSVPAEEDNGQFETHSCSLKLLHWKSCIPIGLLDPAARTSSFSYFLWTLLEDAPVSVPQPTQDVVDYESVDAFSKAILVQAMPGTPRYHQLMAKFTSEGLDIILLTVIEYMRSVQNVLGMIDRLRPSMLPAGKPGYLMDLIAATEEAQKTHDAVKNTLDENVKDFGQVKLIPKRVQRLLQVQWLGEFAPEQSSKVLHDRDTLLQYEQRIKAVIGSRKLTVKTLSELATLLSELSSELSIADHSFCAFISEHLVAFDEAARQEAESLASQLRVWLASFEEHARANGGGS